jgi:hypothetical protein
MSLIAQKTGQILIGGCKGMKIGFLKVLEVLVLFSLCIGFIGISVIGSIIFPGVNKLAYPVVCANGTVQTDRQISNNANTGGVNINTSIYCVNNSSGAKTDITYSSDLVAGPVYSVIILIPLLVLYGIIHVINKLRNPSNS